MKEIKPILLALMINQVLIIVMLVFIRFEIASVSKAIDALISVLTGGFK